MASIAGMFIIFVYLMMGIISLFFGALFLMISTKIFKTENNNYKTALKVLIYPTIVSIIISIILNFITMPLVLLIILSILIFAGFLVWYIYLVKTNYNVSTGKAFIILLISVLIGIVPALILVAIVWAIIIAILFKSTIGI